MNAYHIRIRYCIDGASEGVQYTDVYSEHPIAEVLHAVANVVSRQALPGVEILEVSVTTLGSRAIHATSETGIAMCLDLLPPIPEA